MSVMVLCEKPSVSASIAAVLGAVKPGIGIKGRFYIMRMVQKMIHKDLQKRGQPETVDHIHWRQNGWLDGNKPWQKEAL